MDEEINYLEPGMEFIDIHDSGYNSSSSEEKQELEIDHIPDIYSQSIVNSEWLKFAEKPSSGNKSQLQTQSQYSNKADGSEFQYILEDNGQVNSQLTGLNRQIFNENFNHIERIQFSPQSNHGQQQQNQILERLENIGSKSSTGLKNLSEQQLEQYRLSFNQSISKLYDEINQVYDQNPFFIQNIINKDPSYPQYQLLYPKTLQWLKDYEQEISKAINKLKTSLNTEQNSMDSFSSQSLSEIASLLSDQDGWMTDNSNSENTNLASSSMQTIRQLVNPVQDDGSNFKYPSNTSELIKINKYDQIFPLQFIKYIKLKMQQDKLHQNFTSIYKLKVESYLKDYPCSSQTYLFMRNMKQKDKYKNASEHRIVFQQQLQEVMSCEYQALEVEQSDNIFKQNKGIIDPSLFFIQKPGIPKFQFSVGQESHPKIQTIWKEFTEKLSTYRTLFQDFNMMFTNFKLQKRLLEKQAFDLYANLFSMISTTQLEICKVINDEFQKRNEQFIMKIQTSEDLKEFLQMSIQQITIRKSACVMVEEYTRQCFELFDMADYLQKIKLEVDSIKRNQARGQSPYSLLRRMAKCQKQNEFHKNFYSKVMQRYQEIELDNKVRQKHVQTFFGEVLKLRWGIFPQVEQPQMQTRSQKQKQKLSKLKQKRYNLCNESEKENSSLKRQKVEINQISSCPESIDQVSSPQPPESAFSMLLSFNPRDNLVSQNNFCSQNLPPSMPDQCIEHVIRREGQISKEQALLKMSMDLPHLSVLEKQSSYYIHV